MPEQEFPPDLADRVEVALRALWRGDSAEMDRLVGDDETGAPKLGEVLEGAVNASRAASSSPLFSDAIPGFKIIRELGRGGMGVVYEALQEGTKRTVAVKVVLAGPFASPATKLRFEREVELAARLQHPGIVRVLESRELPTGQRYCAMDYVEGRPVHHYLKVAEPDVRAILKLFVEICEAVQHAHEHGVIHRDLKPGNVLVDCAGRPHVLDFGLAKATDRAEATDSLATSISSPGQIFGTLRYLSPEQAAGRIEEVDARADVYTLGAMLFEALTGSMPYDPDGHPSRIVQQILDEPPRRPSLLSARVNRELETILLKALEKERDRRYQSARELGDDINRYLSGEPILASPPSSVYRLRKGLFKHRVWLALSGAALALMALAVVGGIRWRHQLLEDEYARALAQARQSAIEIQELLERSSAPEAVGQATLFHRQHPLLPESCMLWAQASFKTAQAAGNEAEMRGILANLRVRCEGDAAHWAFLALAADMCRFLGDNAQADTYATRARAATPDTAEASYLLSFATSDIQEAERYAAMAVHKQPEHRLAWQRLAGLRLRAGDLDGAVAAAEALIQLRVDIPQWLCFQGRVLTQERRYRDAIERFSRAIARAPDRVEIYRARGVVYLCLQEYARASDDYSRCLEAVKPNLSIWLYYMRATPRWMLGERDKAADDYREFRRRQAPGSFADARLFLILTEQARARGNRGQTDEAQNARREAQEVLQSGRSATTSGSWLDYVLACVGGSLSPVELVSHANAAAPEQVCESYYYAGETCLLQGDTVQARTMFEKCVQTDMVFDKDSFPPTPMNEYHLARWRLEQLGGLQGQGVSGNQ